MGTCIYCGRPCGWLRREHVECALRHAERVRQVAELARSRAAASENLAQLAKDAMIRGRAIGQVKSAAQSLAAASGLDPQEVATAFLSGWQAAVSAFLEDGLLSHEEEGRVNKYAEGFGLNEEDIRRTAVHMRMVKAGVLREILEGKVPERLHVSGAIPFNLQREEKLVWLFQDVKYYEDKVQRHYEGGHQGFSIRIAKGLYYRAGVFRGYPVESTASVLVDTGLLGITSKHLYFCGPRKALRVPYKKIVSVQPFSDGIQVQRDAATAKPMMFLTRDGWFTYNAVLNLAKLT